MTPKILVYDEEWFPNISYTWGMWEQNVIKIIREGYMLSFHALLNGKHISKGLCDYEGYNGGPEKEKDLAQDLWKLFDEADIVIGFNSDKFDNRKANALFFKYRLGVPSPYKSIDLMKIWKRNFQTNANSLKYIAEYANIKKKMENEGFPLWEGCDQGDPKYWKKMLAYNKQDVVVTNNLYQELLPWIQNHPHVSFDGCRNCGGAVLATTRTYMTKNKGEQTRYQCAKCGHWS